MTEESQEVKIARLEEKLAGADKALSLAEKLGAAEKVAVRADSRSLNSFVLAIISVLIALVALFKR